MNIKIMSKYLFLYLQTLSYFYILNYKIIKQRKKNNIYKYWYNNYDI